MTVKSALTKRKLLLNNGKVEEALVLKAASLVLKAVSQKVAILVQIASQVESRRQKSNFARSV